MKIIIKTFRFILDIIGFMAGSLIILIFLFIKSIERENKNIEKNLYDGY